MSFSEPMGIRDLERVLGASAGALRVHLRKLGEEGLIEATAEKTDRNRKYLRK